MQKRPLPQLARYQIIEVLGQGGMGTVYEAFHTLLQRRVALKVPHSALLKDKVFKERFLREARVLARLQHPNIVSVYDAGIENGYPYIAMQLVEGQTLSHHIHRTTLPDTENVITWGIQIARALDYLHGQGILHRDLKSSNVLISEEGKALITDFGVVHMDSQATITNGILGTPAYMSPEQAMGRTLDGRSDLYSLGAILYEALTGTVPFKDENTLALIQQIIHTRPAPILSLRSDIPTWLAEITHRCLQKKPERRFQTGKQIVSKLQEGRTAQASDDQTQILSESLSSKAWSENAMQAIEHYTSIIQKSWGPIYVKITRVIETFFSSSPTYSTRNRTTGFLKPFQPQVDLSDIIRDPLLIGIVVIWSLMGLSSSFGQRGEKIDGDQTRIESPIDSDSSRAVRKSPRWKPW